MEVWRRWLSFSASNFLNFDSAHNNIKFSLENELRELQKIIKTLCAIHFLMQARKPVFKYNFFLGAEDETNIRMIGIFDNEECGSGSAQGAASKITELVMRRISDHLGDKYFEQAVANSFLLSADQVIVFVHFMSQLLYDTLSVKKKSEKSN